MGMAKGCCFGGRGGQRGLAWRKALCLAASSTTGLLPVPVLSVVDPCRQLRLKGGFGGKGGYVKGGWEGEREAGFKAGHEGARGREAKAQMVP